jgi:integrase
MPAPMTKTKTPGVYKRGSRYVVVYRDINGKQRKESARTYEDARRLKATRNADVARGEYQEQSKTTFNAYSAEWVERYVGRGKRGFRESTRDDYRRLLRNYAHRFFADRTKLTDITPRHIADFIGWLCNEETQGKRLADSTVANALDPVRACLASAAQEGLIRVNPCVGASLPHRPTAEDIDDEDVRALSRQQLADFLAVVNPAYTTFFRLLSVTGLRVSEAIALQWRHLHLDGDRPHVKVRRGFVKGRVQPPKTKYGRRGVPLSAGLVRELRARRTGTEWPRDEDLVFPSKAGTFLDVDNLRKRVLKPVAEEVGVPWAGFHAFRHTCASILFERGSNAVQVQRWLGHHSPAFTLATYVHLLEGAAGDALDLDDELRGNRVATDATALDGNAEALTAPEVAL